VSAPPAIRPVWTTSEILADLSLAGNIVFDADGDNDLPARRASKLVVSGLVIQQRLAESLHP